MEDETPLNRKPHVQAIYIFIFFAVASLMVNKPTEGHLKNQPHFKYLLVSSPAGEVPFLPPIEAAQTPPIAYDLKAIPPLPPLPSRASTMIPPSMISRHDDNFVSSAPYVPYLDIISQAAELYDVDMALIKAIIMAESNYNPKAISKRGARGLMQLMPATAESLGVKDSFDPQENIHGGVRYFRQLLDRFNDDVKLALAAYNAGSRYVRKYKGIPPFGATRKYIKKVIYYQDKYGADT